MGITALELQLPSDTVYVPALPTIRISAVDSLIRFNQRMYTFPDHNHNILVKQIIAADALGADVFLTYIEEKLCIPKAQFNMSHSYDSLYRVVRDRYRLATRVILHFPPRNICYVCKNDLSSPDIRTVSCCNRTFHQKCITSRKKCPYCTESWMLLDCCKCNSPCTVTPGDFYSDYAIYTSFRLECCSLDIHHECGQQVTSRCPGCGTNLQDGLPCRPATADEFCRRRAWQRNSDKRRNELAAM